MAPRSLRRANCVPAVAARNATEAFSHCSGRRTRDAPCAGRFQHLIPHRGTPQVWCQAATRAISVPEPPLNRMWRPRALDPRPRLCDSARAFFLARNTKAKSLPSWPPAWALHHQDHRVLAAGCSQSEVVPLPGARKQSLPACSGLPPAAFATESRRVCASSDASGKSFPFPRASPLRAPPGLVAGCRKALRCSSRDALGGLPEVGARKGAG
jgi:hypothetical protein